MKCPRENYSIHLLLFLARKPFDLFSPPAINALSSPPLRKLEDRPSDLYTKVVWTLLSLLSLSLSLSENQYGYRRRLQYQHEKHVTSAEWTQIYDCPRALVPLGEDMVHETRDERIDDIVYW